MKKNGQVTLLCGLVVLATILEDGIGEYAKKVKERDGKDALHAMVMIGAYHQSKEDRFWFLLQNFHVGGFFKIVDGEFLASSRPVIYFARDDAELSLKHDYCMSDGNYIESAFALEECMDEEIAEW